MHENYISPVFIVRMFRKLKEKYFTKILSRPRLVPVVIIGCLLFLTLAFFRKLIWTNGVFFGIDLVYFYPERVYLFGEMRDGSIPLWNPYIFCGTPSVSNSSIFGLFYPLNIIFLLVSSNVAFNWTVIIHVFLAGLFMYLLVRELGIDVFGSLISGIIFMFSGSFIVAISTGVIEILSGITWIPLIFLFFEKAIKKNSLIYTVLAGIAIGLQGLGGHPQILMYTSYALLFYFLFRIGLPSSKKERLQSIGRITLLFVFALIIGYGLYAIQLIPQIEIFSKFSSRSGSLSYLLASSYSFHPKHLVTYFSPDFFGNPITGQYWGELNFDELCSYVGILPLILALLAILFVRNKYVKFYFGLAVISLLIAFGKYGPLHRIFYHILPGFNIFRCPSRWLYFSTFSFSILAGFGSSLLTNKVRHKQGLTLLIKILLLISLLLIILLIFERFTEKSLLTLWIRAFTTSPWGQEVPFHTRYSGALKSLYITTLILMISGLSIFLRLKEKIGPKIFGGLVIILVLCNLWIFGAKFIIPVKEEFYLASKQWEFFEKDKNFYRVMTQPPINDYGATANAIFSLGGEPRFLELKDYAEFQQQVKNFTRILNTEYLLTIDEIDNDGYEYLTSKSIKIIEPFNLKKIEMYDGEMRIYRNTDFMPRALIVHKAKVIKDKDTIFKKLNSESFNPKELVILEEEPEFKLNTVPTMPSEDRVMITDYSANRIKLEAYLENAGFLVLNEVYFPGWKVYVNNQQERIFKANYLLRAVYLEKGEHEVEFVYDPLSFKIGKYISLLTLITIFILVVVKYGLYLFKKIKDEEIRSPRATALKKPQEG